MESCGFVLGMRREKDTDPEAEAHYQASWPKPEGGYKSMWDIGADEIVANATHKAKGQPALHIVRPEDAE